MLVFTEVQVAERTRQDFRERYFESVRSCFGNEAEELIGMTRPERRYKKDIDSIRDTNWWRERLDKYETDHGTEQTLFLVDAVQLVESLARLTKSVNCNNFYGSVYNFSYACRDKYGIEFTEETMRGNFATRIALLNGFGGEEEAYKKLAEKLVESKNKKDKPVAEKPIPGKSVSEKPVSKGLEDIVEGVPQMDESVYTEYRGGGFKNGRVGIEIFDRAVGFLLKNNLIKFDKNGMNPELVDSSEAGEIMNNLRTVAGNWCGRKGAIDSEMMVREFYAGIERWGMNLMKDFEKNPSLRSTDYIADDSNWMENPGVNDFQIGLVLTEETRNSVSRSADSRFRKKLPEYHRDRSERFDGVMADDLTKMLLKQRTLLTSAKEFSKISGGW